ncbi:MAG: preprotein translocase subunit YajC [Bacillota bacterium]|nr:preprotein translocase subunit YajC [Bacillota bacterium]
MLNSIPGWIWTVIIFVVFVLGYLITNIFHYRKNTEAAIKFQNELQPGDKIVLSSGIHGVIKKIDKQTAVVSLNDKNDVVVERFCIVRLEKDLK